MIRRFANLDISQYTTFHLPAIVKEFIEYDTVDELIVLVTELNAARCRFIHLGGGSNMLFPSRYNGVVLHCCSQKIIETGRDSSHAFVYAAAGTVWDDFVKYTVKANLYGGVNLSYIPGEVGGAVVQNVGAYGAEAKDIIESVEVLDITDMNCKKLSVDSCAYGYRDSIFKHEAGRYIVTGANFKLSLLPAFSLEYGPLSELASDAELTLGKVRDRIISIRRSKLPEPSELGSAGSFFKNPVVNYEVYARIKCDYPDIPSYHLNDGTVKIPAGWLIERAGMKGFRIGGAEVYPKQCLVIVNTGNATEADVINLKNHVQHAVKTKFGIEISPEVNIIES